MRNPLVALKKYFIADYLAQTENVFDKARIELLYTYSVLLTVIVWPFQIMLFFMGFLYQFYLNIFACLMIFVILWVIKEKKNVKMAGALYTILQILNSYLHGIVYSFTPTLQGTFWILMGVLIAFFVVGKKAGVIASFFLVIFILFCIANKESGYAYFHFEGTDSVLPESQLFVMVPVGFNLYLLWLFAKTSSIAEKQLFESNRRNEELLLNILPEETANELKLKGHADAKYYDEVTVLFADIKNFSSIAEKISPQDLVSELHLYFKTFDKIISEYKIEKIKTIGDAYLCANGIPAQSEDSAKVMILAAKEFLNAVKELNEGFKKQDKIGFEFRIGIHTGPIVSGVVGIKKFAYDIWGDTVNIASRMESSGETGKINISGATYELVKNNFTCIHRGKIQAKNKGMIDMYFVE